MSETSRAVLPLFSRILVAGYDVSELWGYTFGRECLFASNYWLWNRLLLVDSNVATVFKYWNGGSSIVPVNERVIYIYGERPGSSLCLGYVRATDLVLWGEGKQIDQNVILFVEADDEGRLYVGYSDGPGRLRVVACRLNSSVIDDRYARAKSEAAQSGRGDVVDNEIGNAFASNVILNSEGISVIHNILSSRRFRTHSSRGFLAVALWSDALDHSRGRALLRPSDIFVMRFRDGSVAESRRVNVPASPIATPAFGERAVLQDGKLFVSDPYARGSNSTVGAVHCYDLDAAEGGELNARLTIFSSSLDYCGFGSFILGKGKQLLVGSPSDDTFGTIGGSIALFDADFGDHLGYIGSAPMPNGCRFGENFCLSPSGILYAYLAPSEEAKFGSIVGLRTSPGSAIETEHRFAPATETMQMRRSVSTRAFEETGFHPDFQTPPLKYDPNTAHIFGYFRRWSPSFDRLRPQDVVHSPGVVVFSDPIP